MDNGTREALHLIATRSGSPQVRQRAAKILSLGDDPSESMLTHTARMALSEPHWMHDQLRLIGSLLAISDEDHTRSATLPAVRVYPEERETAERLANEHDMSLAEWIRHRVTTTP